MDRNEPARELGNCTHFPSNVEEIIITDSAAAVEETITAREEVIRVRGLEESLVHFACRTAAGPVISDHFSLVLASAVQM